jgi:hypothetical protein
MTMAGKDLEGECVKESLPGLGFISRRKKLRPDRKHALKIQLCHAMDQIAIDVRQAIEIFGRSGGSEANQ